jgi:hypothetical protein
MGAMSGPSKIADPAVRKSALSGRYPSAARGQSLDARQDDAVAAAANRHAADAGSRLGGAALSAALELVRDWVVQSCAAQGIPTHVTDPGVLRDVAVIARLEANDLSPAVRPPARASGAEGAQGRRRSTP